MRSRACISVIVPAVTALLTLNAHAATIVESGISKPTTFSGGVDGTLKFSPVVIYTGDKIEINVTFTTPIVFQHDYTFASYNILSNIGIPGNNAIPGTSGYDHLPTVGSPNFSSRNDLTGFATTVGIVGPTYPNAEATIYGIDYYVAVPEPTTWAFLIVGLGAVGMALRRQGVVSA